MSKFTDAVIAAAQLSQKTWGVPASVSLAQFALESAYGTRMPTGSNNPFGIKASGNYPFVTSSTREVIGGKSVIVQAKFRKFADFNEAFDAHAKLLATVGLYASAMKAWKVDHDLETGVRLMSAHYATDPSYAAKILSIIQAQQLVQYDHGQPVVPAPSAPVAPTPSVEPAKPVNWLSALIDLILNLIKGLRK